jgi:hypothetical protein
LRKVTDVLPSALNGLAFKQVAVEKEDLIYNRGKYKRGADCS